MVTTDGMTPQGEVRDIEHVAYFPTPEARAAFVYSCLKAGFRLRNTSEPAEPGAGFGAILFHKEAPTQEALERASRTLKSIAAGHGGRYDGREVV